MASTDKGGQRREDTLDSFPPKLWFPDQETADKPLLSIWSDLKYSQYFINWPDGGVYVLQVKIVDERYSYGAPKTIAAFTERAQLVSYMHYKELWEGYLTHMWQRYTGMNIWISQSLWTGLRAQLYG